MPRCTVPMFNPPANTASHAAEQLPGRQRAKPVGLGLCWEPMPGNPARNCTIKGGHNGPHLHEYSGIRWDRSEGQA